VTSEGVSAKPPMSALRPLSDEHLAYLEQAVAKIDNDYKPTCVSASYGNGCPGPTSESIEFWRRAVDCVPSMIAELRARRAADLSEAERAALLTWRNRMMARGSNRSPQADEVYALIDRLLGELPQLAAEDLR
jgi:hypothetical protein